MTSRENALTNVTTSPDAMPPPQKAKTITRVC